MCDSNLIVITSYFVVFDHTSPPHYPYIYWKPWEKGWGRKKEENVKEGIIWFFWYISMWDGKGVEKKRKRKMWKKSLFGSCIYLDVRRAMREIWDSFFFFLRKKKYLISKYQWGYNWKNHSLKKQKFQKKKLKMNFID